MKIKIIKDIPGYNIGEVTEEEEGYCIKKAGVSSYNTSFLLANGFSEEIKDDIDIEAIRNAALEWECLLFVRPQYEKDGINGDIKWLTSYRIVKAFIDHLNGEWKPEWEEIKNSRYLSEELKWFITGYHLNIEEFNVVGYYNQIHSIIPACKDKETAQKVIELCEPELKILFGVK